MKEENGIKEYRMRKLDPHDYEKLIKKKYNSKYDEKDILFSEFRTDLFTIVVGCIHMLEVEMGHLWDHPGSYAPPARGYKGRFDRIRTELFDRVNLLVDKWKDKLVDSKEDIKERNKS